MPQDDPITKQLRALRSELPEGRDSLSESEKDALVLAVGGPRTCRSIVASKKNYPLERIPFIFNNLNTQAVMDILANDMEQAIARALQKKKVPR